MQFTNAEGEGQMIEHVKKNICSVDENRNISESDMAYVLLLYGFSCVTILN